MIFTQHADSLKWEFVTGEDRTCSRRPDAFQTLCLRVRRISTDTERPWQPGGTER